MIGSFPIASFGARNMQALGAVRPVTSITPVVRGSGNAAAPVTVPSRDSVTLRGDSPKAADGLYTRKGTVSASVERQQSFDLEIQTAEGDSAVLHFSQSAGISSTVNAESRRGASSVEARQESYATLDVQIDIQGHFNDTETQAMDRLLQQANQVAEQFFAGDLNTANTEADKLQLSGDALQSFSMNLSSREMRQVSAAYEEVARYAAPATPAAGAEPLTPPSSDRLPGSDLLKGLKQLLAALVSDAQNPRVVTDAVDKTAQA